MKKILSLVLALVLFGGWFGTDSASAQGRKNYNSSANIAAHKKALQGNYLATCGGGFTSPDQIRQYGMYSIKGDVITEYSWDSNKRKWIPQYSSKFVIKYIYNNYYMTGYNLIFKTPYSNDQRLCSGDVNDDGKMDLWMSDGLFHTKQ